MSTYPTAEDEKRLLAHAAESTTVLAADDAKRPKCRHVCRRRMAGVKSVAHIVAMLAFVATCCIAVLGLSSLAVGTLRHTRAMSCGKHSNGAEGATVAPEVVVAVGAETTPATGFTRLLEAVSPESLHDLLHEYLPDTYKHGVYPSEKKAMEAVHRANAALATNIVQLARRDLNGNGTVSSNGSSMPTSSTFKNSSSSAATHSSKASTTVGTTSSRRTIYTSTVNGTPTVVTATTVVGVGASNTGGASATNSGTLQTGAAVPMLSSQKKVLALAGAVIGAILI
ncbi:hypothetical protein SEPCBS57363_001522 [Sporothrix epigloea]|uniref:Uncharacterized protein n=1 Tax=Sporothrix epigloea TaxID=1892477 RepID=A0ABP0DEK4_9PEZI